MRRRLCRSRETAEDVAFGPRSRKRHALLLAAGMAVSCGAAAFLLAFQAGPADAAGTVSCVTSGTALDIAVSGTASDSLLVTTSGGSYQIEFDGTAACTATTYSDTAYPAVQVTDTGAGVPVVFQPGTDDGVDFEGPGLSATLDLSGAPAGVVVSVPAGSVTGLSGGGSDSFSGITAFTGSPAGSTDFVAGPGSAVFTGQGPGNELDFSAVPTGPSAPLVVNAGAGPVNGTASGTATAGPVTYVFAGITVFKGSSDGSTDFVAGPGSAVFTGQGPGNELDFSAVPTGPSAPLVVNAGAGPVNGTASDTATAGPVTDLFAGIQNFTGSSSGDTEFEVGSVGGLALTGQGIGNTLSFAGATPGGVQVSLDPNAQGVETAEPGTGTDTFTDLTTIVGSGGNDTFSGGPGNYSITDTGANNTFSDAPAPDGITVSFSAGTGSVTGGFSGTTTTTGVTTFVGSAAGGNTFDAPAGGGYTFEGGGTGNTLDLSGAPAGVVVSVPAGSVTGLSGGGSDSFSGITAFTGSPAGSTDFVAGPGSAVFTGQGSGNELDFSAVPTASGTPLVVNAGPGPVNGIASGTATAGSTTYVFAGITAFKGSSDGSTDFLAGLGNAVFTGQGLGNTLDFSAVPTGPSAPLVVNAGPGPVNGVASGTATAGATTYVFAGIQDFTGSSDGSTDFVAPAAGGYTFTGQGSGNTLDLSAAPAGATVTLNGDSPASPGVVANLNSGPGGSTSDEFSGITVNQAAQSISFTAPATGTVGGSATLTATGGASGNPVVFSVDPTSGAGVCTVSGTNGTTVNYTAAGNCVIDANQAGDASYTAAPQVTQAITVNQAPAFVVDSPPLTATAGQPYDYTFTASGTPAPAYALASGAPSWLSVDASTGEVMGTPPAGTTSFSYTVTATNVAGAATAGPFTVTVTKAATNANISAVLHCPASITAGGTGTCTLTVANAGPATASNVTAAIVLPSALSETACSSGCARHSNVYTWTLASLGDGASAQFSITVKASRAGIAAVLAVATSQSPDHEPLNNISLQLITIKR